MKWPWRKKRLGSGGQPIPDIGKPWTRKQKVEEVQHWARSVGLTPITLPCGHVFCALRIENGKVIMPGAGRGFELDLSKGCPYGGCHDEEGRAINP